jgi:hypothetical protein
MIHPGQWVMSTNRIDPLMEHTAMQIADNMDVTESLVSHCLLAQHSLGDN